MAIAAPSHILVDENGVAFVEGTRTRVAMIAMDRRNGLSPEQIHEAYPYLSLSQVYAALSYYLDHEIELDGEIAAELQQIASIRADAGGQASREELLRRLAGGGEKP